MLTGVNPTVNACVPPAGTLMGSWAPASEKVWPETLIWEMTMDVGLGFVIVTLLEADTPISTLPKSTVPGVTRMRASEADTVTPDPQPDAATAKQQATARTKAVHTPSKPRGRVPGQLRTLFRS